jgi:hypothetical protein
MTEDEMAYSMKIEQYWVIKSECVLRIEEETVDRSQQGRPLTIQTHVAPDLSPPVLKWTEATAKS